MTEPARIHPTAIVERGAEIGAGTAVGPYSIIGSAVRIGPDSEVGAHVVLEGRVAIGARFCGRGDQASFIESSSCIHLTFMLL